MADITIISVTRCSGGSHWTFTGTYNGKNKSISINPQKISENWEDISPQERFECRIYQECLEKNITTFVQAKNNFEGKNIKI